MLVPYTTDMLVLRSIFDLFCVSFSGKFHSFFRPLFLENGKLLNFYHFPEYDSTRKSTEDADCPGHSHESIRIGLRRIAYVFGALCQHTVAMTNYRYCSKNKRRFDLEQ